MGRSTIRTPMTDGEMIVKIAPWVSVSPLKNSFQQQKKNVKTNIPTKTPLIYLNLEK